MFIPEVIFKQGICECVSREILSSPTQSRRGLEDSIKI